VVDICQELLDDLYAHDQARDRSRQRSLGMSEIGICRRRAQYIMQGQAGNGRGSGMAAIVGTALHETIAAARKHRGLLQEQEVRLSLLDGHTIVGHVDEIDLAKRVIRDWKGSTEGKIAEVRLHGPQQTYINQVHLYAAAALEGGLLIDDGRPVILELIFIDRNGKVPPYCWSTRYTPEGLAPALEWLHEVKDGVASGEWMPQDKPVTWCQDYCQFFEVCRVPWLSDDTQMTLEGEEADDARTYLDLSRREAEVVAAKAEVKGRLKGVQGVTSDGVRVRWTSYERDSYSVKAGSVERLDVRRGK
jgi:hypothetical protein